MSKNRPQHHTNNNRFRNPKGSRTQDATLGDFLKFMLSQIKRKTFAVPEEHILPLEEVRSGWEESHPSDSLMWLGHAAFLLRLENKTILIDPYLSDYASPVPFLGPKRFAPPGLSVQQLPPIDMILQTHAHYDHLDSQTLRAIPNKSKVQVVTTLGVGKYFRSYGYSNVVELDWHQSHEWNHISVTALPAIHFSRRGLFDGNKALWASYAIQTPKHKIFFSGDTAYGDVFKTIGEQTGPFDLSIVGIGAYEPRAIMQPVHASPEEAIQIAKDLGSDTVVAMHWGTIVLSSEEPFEPPVRFKDAGRQAGYTEEKLWVMKIGETKEIPERLTGRG